MVLHFGVSLSLMMLSWLLSNFFVEEHVYSTASSLFYRWISGQTGSPSKPTPHKIHLIDLAEAINHNNEIRLTLRHLRSSNRRRSFSCSISFERSPIEGSFWNVQKHRFQHDGKHQHKDTYTLISLYLIYNTGCLFIGFDIFLRLRGSLLPLTLSSTSRNIRTWR